jgi:hypothetical protein
MDNKTTIPYDVDVDHNHKTAVASTASIASTSYSSLLAQSDDGSASATGAKVEHLLTLRDGDTASGK